MLSSNINKRSFNNIKTSDLYSHFQCLEAEIALFDSDVKNSLIKI